MSCYSNLLLDTSHRDVWNIKVDPDIFDTIKNTFPNWFATSTTNLLTTNNSTVASTSKFTGVQTPFSIKIEDSFVNFIDLEAMANGEMFFFNYLIHLLREILTHVHPPDQS